MSARSASGIFKGSTTIRIAPRTNAKTTTRSALLLHCGAELAGRPLLDAGESEGRGMAAREKDCCDLIKRDELHDNRAFSLVQVAASGSVIRMPVPDGLVRTSEMSP